MKKINKNIVKLFSLFLTVGALVLLPGTSSEGNELTKPQTPYEIQSLISYTSDLTSPYQGHLRIYIVEPVSRWNNNDRNPYHFGFLDFAFDDTIQIPYGESYHDSIVWDASEAGFSDVTEDNIMVIAAIFNPQSNRGYANPPIGNKFNAHYVDASAGALLGDTGSNMVNDEFTHSVFVEEGTATWCPYCPAMAEALYSVYQSGDYPFYFVALIGDKNTKADSRLQNDYNLYGYPTSFFDGGHKVIVGGYDDISYYTNRIEASGKRDVHELDFTITPTWHEEGVISIKFDITNKEDIANGPPEIPTITGETEGRIGTEYNFTIVSIDPDGNDVYYRVQWGEGCPSIEWIGPYPSGEEVIVSNTWTDKGDFMISAKAKDIYDEESDWGTLEIHMAKTKTWSSVSSIFFHRLIEKFPVLSTLFPQFFSMIFS
jgi:thiol-disulfide isomerase/thioredoxin